MEGAYLENTDAPDDDKKAFYQNWISQFQSFADMKVEGQQHLLTVLKKTNDPEADSLQQDIVLANRSSDIDVGIQGSWDGISAKIQNGDWDGARLDFEKSIRDFGEQGGGTLFYSLISPYVSACIKSGQLDLADRALKFTEDRMPLEKRQHHRIRVQRAEGQSRGPEKIGLLRLSAIIVSGTELERVVDDLRRAGTFGFVDDHRNFDLAGGDHLDV